MAEVFKIQDSEASSKVRAEAPLIPRFLAVVPGLGFKVYPTGSFPGTVFSGIYRVSLFLCFSLKGFRRVFRV